MATMEEHYVMWWDSLNEDQRARVKKVAEHHRLDTDGTKLLFDVRCPIGPVGVKWETDPGFSWSWPESLRTFVREQS